MNVCVHAWVQQASAHTLCTLHARTRTHATPHLQHIARRLRVLQLLQRLCQRMLCTPSSCCRCCQRLLWWVWVVFS